MSPQIAAALFSFLASLLSGVCVAILLDLRIRIERLEKLHMHGGDHAH